MTKIKVCGITNADIARSLIDVPIDAIGLVFYDLSPRFVNIEIAQDIISKLPPFINRVGLFVNASSDFIDNIIDKVALDTLQFHGDENPSECNKYQMPYIKAIRVNNNTNILQYADDFYQASGLLLDTDNKKLYGGSGKVFDWSLAQVNTDKAIILAGGLNINNVVSAINTVKPYGVDVSSGVETKKAVKDMVKIKQFVAKVRGNSEI